MTPTCSLPPMEQLIEVLEGRWHCHVVYEPTPDAPDRGSAVGWEECRVGPGRWSIFFDTRARGEAGIFGGYEFVAGRRFTSRHSITDISAETFVHTIDIGSAPGNLRREAVIRYTRE